MSRAIRQVCALMLLAPVPATLSKSVAIDGGELYNSTQ